MKLIINNYHNNFYTKLKDTKNTNPNIQHNNTGFHGINIKKRTPANTNKSLLVLLNSIAIFVSALFNKSNCKTNTDKLINKIKNELMTIDPDKLTTKDNKTEKLVNKIFNELYNDIKNNPDNYKKNTVADSRGLPRHYTYYNGELLMMESYTEDDYNNKNIHLYLNDKIISLKQHKG